MKPVNRSRQQSPFSGRRVEFYGPIQNRVIPDPKALWDFELQVGTSDDSVVCVINSRRLQAHIASKLVVLTKGLWVAGLGRLERRGCIAVERLLAAPIAGPTYDLEQLRPIFDAEYF